MGDSINNTDIEEKAKSLFQRDLNQRLAEGGAFMYTWESLSERTRQAYIKDAANG